MKSRITKIAAAVVIIIAVLVGIKQFGGSIDGAGVALGDTIRTMKKMPWVHVMAEVDTTEHKGPMDSWVSFQPYIMVLKRPDGTILYADLSEEVKYDYDLLNNTITISAVPDLSNTMGPKSHFDLLEHMIENLEANDAEISREESVLDGKAVEIIHSVSDIQDVRMVRDKERNLLISAESQKFVNGPEQGAVVIKFEYPQQGPADIYAVGVPRDAKVVDNRPKGSLKDLTKEIQRRFDKGFGDYIAVVLESSGSREEPNNPSYPNMVLVMRRSGQLWRLDRYLAIDTSLHKNDRRKSLYEAIKDIWANPTIKQILESEDEEALVGQVLFDGRYSISCTQIGGKIHKNKWRGDSSKFSTEVLPAIVWTNPFMLTMGNENEEKIIESLEMDPNHAQLIGLRVRTTAKDKKKDYNQPWEGTDDYWFDPARDYILMEHIRQKEAGHESRSPFSRSVVTAAAQTFDGRWYPKVIRTESIRFSRNGEKQRRIREKRILLDTKPTFKRGIFDESSLLE
ncbi:MAG: hypothetical protein ACYS0C_05685 [Planctomycetota bacterium]